MGRCRVCGRESALIASTLSVCAGCIKEGGEAAGLLVEKAHSRVGDEFDLPSRSTCIDGARGCSLCANACRLEEGDVGLCGLRTVREGRLVHLAGTRDGALVDWYDDPLPTNCVADWVCEGSRQLGMVNLAVFYQACTFNCLSCQNWHFRLRRPPGTVTAAQLAAQAHAGTFCICFFGGDPAPQMPHALAVARRLAGQGVRICWETNGSGHPWLMDQAVELSLESGGCIKFDIKAFDGRLHTALTGAPNQQTLSNFARAARRAGERPDPPLVVASTLLVPGYVEVEEVARIAGFIASLDRSIPYSLLGFHPHFYLPDLPRTSVRHAEAAGAAACAAGLLRVRIGNRHLLSRDY